MYSIYALETKDQHEKMQPYIKINGEKKLQMTRINGEKFQD